MKTDLNKQKMASFWYLLANIMQKGAYLILIPLYTRVLSIEEYGIYTVLDSWMEIFLVIISLNLFQNIYSVAVNKFNDKTGVSSAFCGISLLFVADGISIILIWRDFFCSIFRINLTMMLAFFIYLLSNPVYMIWCTMKRYHYEYKELIIVTLVKSVLIIGLGVMVVWADNNMLLIVIYAKAVSELIVALYAIFDIYKKNHAFYCKEYWKFAIKMGVPLVPYYLSLRILQHLDRIMISHIEGTEAAAKYGLINKVTSAVMMINSSLNSAFLPWLYSAYKEKKQLEINNVYRKIVLLIFLINASISFFAPEIVRVLGPEEYYDSVYIMAPLAMCSIFIFVYDQCVNVELYYERNKANSAFAILISILNAVLNLIFIKKYGYIAAGYTTFFSYLIYMMLHIGYIHILSKKKNILKIYTAKDITLFMLLCFITITNVIISYSLTWLRYSFLIIVFLLFICVMKKIDFKSILRKNSSGGIK